MPWTAHDQFHVSPGYQALMRELGLDAQAVFSHPDIKVWRSITERENATLDATREDGTAVRLHVKRYHPAASKISPAEQEAAGIKLLQQAGIPTVPLVGYGQLTDGRSFILSEDLAGYQPADKALANGTPVEKLLPLLAGVAAKLHRANLHHRDLYLCHYFVNSDLDVRLIDAGRVKALPGWPLRRRWVVKDVAQTVYSLGENGVPMEGIHEFLRLYGDKSGVPGTLRLTRAVEAKTRRIARHDQNLRNKQPSRNVSIPE